MDDMGNAGDVKSDLGAFLNATHLPRDAGEHSEGLAKILGRIPDGWGRWIGCDKGWYQIIVRLDGELSKLVPEYEIHQVKEKYGTLRFYCGSPVREPSCCTEFALADPRPVPGAVIGPFVPKDRSIEDQALLEAWVKRHDEHLSSPLHEETVAAMQAEADPERAAATREKVQDLIDAAELESARTCETCGGAGSLHDHHGWLKTLCGPCAGASGYEPVR